MPRPTVRFQTLFGKSTISEIKRRYNLSSRDELLMAIWITDKEYSVFDRMGFVITKEGLAWNYEAIAESAVSGVKNKERTPRKNNYLEKKNIIFLGTNICIADTIENLDGKTIVQLRTSGTVYNFSFDSRIKHEKIAALERAIAAQFSDCLDLSEYEKLDESYSFFMTLITFCDFFRGVGKKLKDKFLIFKSKFSKNVRKVKSEETKNSAVLTINKVGAFFRHIIDSATDLILMIAVLIFTKPQLLVKDFFQGITAKISGLTISIFYYDYTKEITKEIIDKRNFIFVILVGLFLILKFLISLSCRKNRKAVTALLLIMLVLNFLLITDKFLVFSTFLLLILIAIQFSMGFSSKVIGIKSVIFIFICLIGYFGLHIFLYENFSELLCAVFETLSLPVKWW